MSVEPRKPNLFIVGAMKCGTTAWYDYLRSHPDIFMPEKEPGFFAFDLPNWRGFQTEEEYLDLFSAGRSARVLGEVSPIYLLSETAARANRDLNPAAKILIFLRDQEEYLPSVHNLNRLEFAEDIEDFETAWRLSGRRSPETIPAGVDPKVLDYKAMGRFHEQVARYLNEFGADRVRIFWYRDWVADPRATYVAILRFLGLEDDGRSEFPVVNRGIRFRARWLVRSLYDPPKSIRKIVRLVKRATSMEPETQDKLVHKAVQLLKAPGYRKEITSKLRDEIRLYYADDNRRLNDLLVSAGLAQVSGSQTTPDSVA